jgi:hypothetical protein
MHTRVTLLLLLLTATASISAAAQAPSSPWSVVTSPNPGTQDILQGIGGASSSDVWAVGLEFENYTSQFNLAEHWDGTSWTAIPTPNPGDNSSECGGFYQNDLIGVAEISANDVWAVGQYCTVGPNDDVSYLTLTEHWNGTAWTVIPSPNPSQISYLEGVAALATNNVWAVGQNYDGSTGIPVTLIEHWNGTAWSVVPSPNPAGRTAAYLSAVAAVSPTNIWAVGYSSAPINTIPLIEHYNGTSWSIVDSPYVKSSRFNQLNGIGIIAPDDVWAVGYENNDGRGEAQTGLFEHWNGKSWSLISAPPIGINGELQFWGVAGVSSDNIWAFGSTWNENLDMVPLIEHWNGEKWAVVNAPDPGESAQLFGAALVEGQTWAVGDYGKQPGGDPPNPLTLIITNQ